MVNGMNKIVKRVQDEFKKNPDLITKEIPISMFDSIWCIFLETVSGSDKVNDYILKSLIANKEKINKNNLDSFLAGPNTTQILEVDQIEFYLTNGFTVIILKDQIFAIETKADLTRSINISDVEPSINGPKDAFVENYQTNIGLIKRRLKSCSLKIENRIVGRKTSTQVGVLYFDDIADKGLVKNILERIDAIDIDGILDASSLAFLLDGENKSVYPTVYQTERPDIVAMALLEGKVVIMTDTSPFALILPSYLIDYINPNFDNYNKSVNVNFIKILRIISFFITIATPALYVALINFNQEAIPTTLLINFAVQRDGVPFPAVIETVIMLFICEILRESDLRFPSSYGSAISVLGAIIIGEASVSAGIVTPIMIIIVAITFISNLIFTNTELNNAIRFFRVIFTIGAALFGLYGLMLAFLFFFIYTLNTTSFNHLYFAPFAPFDKSYFNDTVVKQPLRKDTKRSRLFVKDNLTKEKENL